jgi:outer membrane protein assembly factor BamB
VNGDGMPDPISGTFGTSGNELTAIDARHGTVLWSTPFPDDQPSVWCAAGGLFVEHSTGFVLERRDPKNGAVAWSHPLPDKVESVAASPTCVRFVSTNAALSVFDVATGATTGACTPTEVADPRTLRSHHGFVVGDLSIDVAKTGSGTPRIAVTATRNGKPAWQRTLDMKPAVIDPDAALAPGGLFVVGKKPGDDHKIVYAYLRAESGDVVFQKEEVTRSSESVDTMAPSAGLMIVSGTGRARAVDLATGAVVWQSPAPSP